MKRMVIKAPAPGRSTVQLLTHQYVSRKESVERGIERGTRTVYLGSFPLDLDPNTLANVETVRAGDASCGISLRPGVRVDEQEFELTVADILEIRTWLEVFGSCAERDRQRARLAEQQERQRQQERAELEARVRAELQVTLRQEVRADIEREMKAQARHPIEEAVHAVGLAGAAVEAEAALLHEKGLRLSTRRAKVPKADSEPVMRLLEMTRALRTEAFSRFEDACKAAGLMHGRKAGASRPRGSRVRRT